MEDVLAVYERPYHALPPGLHGRTQQAAAWEHERSARRSTVTWRLTTPDARIQLHRLYPSF
jgi:hypothetical protein